MALPHTFGGVCVYCKATGTKASHLETCRPYQLIVEQELQQEKEDLAGLMASDEEEEDKENRPPIAQTKKRKSEAEALSKTSKGRRVSISPLQDKASSDGRSPTSHSIWNCLACGEKNCAFENGATVLEDTKEEEHDPDQLNALVGDCKEWTRNEAVNFEVCKAAIMSVTMGVLLSKGFFGHNKFMGSKALDLKLKTWMKYRVPSNLVDSNWTVFRETAKMSLEYKRQACVGSMRLAFKGEQDAVQKCKN